MVNAKNVLYLIVINVVNANIVVKNFVLNVMIYIVQSVKNLNVENVANNAIDVMKFFVQIASKNVKNVGKVVVLFVIFIVNNVKNHCAAINTIV